ncbi:zinc finger CCHC domain-containing protein 24 [Aphomia sociella]
MGSCCSTEGSDERCMYCNHRAVNNLQIIDYVCEICIVNNARRQELSRSQSSSATGGPYFGEYRCSSCRRTWCSRLSWPHSYQICKRCRSHVYAHTQRALIPSDRTADRENRPEHQMDGCQMCQQLGYYCGNFNRRVGNRGKY